jgi:hypothetical protein
MVAQWYMQNVGTPYELSGLPKLYQEYVGHDNNRDAYMLNMVESRVLEHTWRQWEPQIIYVHHQSGPFPTRIWLPPFSEPVGSEAPFIMSREVNMIGMAIAKGLEERGQVGATHMGTAFDAWYPGYVDYAPNFKNIAAFWTETALYQYATPHEYTINDFPQNMRDLRPQSLYSSPWPPACGALQDAVDYMETASMAVLEFAAKYKDSLLFDRYKSGVDQIALGRPEGAVRVLRPRDQRDPVAAVELVRRLAFGGLRIYQLAAAATVGGDTLAEGTWVIPHRSGIRGDGPRSARRAEVPGPPSSIRVVRRNGRTTRLAGRCRCRWAFVSWQPMRRSRTRIRRTMRLVGTIPDSKVKPTPYEAALRSDAAPFDSVPGLGFNSDPNAAAILPPAGRVTGTGPILVIDPAQNNAYRALNRAWEQGAKVQASADASGSPVRYAIMGLSDGAQNDLVESLALRAERTLSAPGRAVRRPRLGLFQPWTGSMDEGWTRWLLEQYGFSYLLVHPDDFKSPLTDKIDVLIIADDARVPIAGGCVGRTRPFDWLRAAGRRRPRRTPGVRVSADAERPAGVRAVRAQRRHACLPQQRERFRDSAVQAAGAQCGRRTAAGGVFLARLDRRE